jgi:polysaccharide pyruvyl transferase WcaK-like protein
MMRLLVCADVGGWETYHAGDEAMLDANLGVLRTLQSRLTPTVISNDPAWTSAEYNVDAVSDRGLRPDAHPDDFPPDAVRYLEHADGLLISGGGNLSSTWPQKIRERVALFRAARAHGLPIVILGQTLGPNLTNRDRDFVSELVCGASWVGVRDASSFSLALALGAPLSRLSYQPDDAIHLPEKKIDAAWAEPLTSPRAARWIAITFHPLGDFRSDGQIVERLSNELRQIARSTGAPLVFIPHAAASNSNSPWSDREFGEALASALRPGIEITVAPLLRAREIRWLTSHADLIISSRYHPVVFGLAGNRPSFGVHTSEYTRAKLEGALIHYDRSADSCSLDEALAGRLSDNCLQLWNNRDRIGVELARNNTNITSQDSQRLNALGRIFEGADARPNEPDLASLVTHLAAAIQRSSVAIERLSRSLEQAAAQMADLAQSRSTSEHYALTLLSEGTRMASSLESATAYAQQLEHARTVAESYAQSLDRKVTEVEQYARSLETELSKRPK